MSVLNLRDLQYNTARPKYSAGILPYQIGSNGKVYILVGEDVNGAWSDFGGKCEPRDRNVPKNTAIREFFEESLNSVSDKSSVIDLLGDNDYHTTITSRTASGSPYYMFVTRLPMLPDTCRDRFSRTRTYMKAMRIRKYSALEKTDIKWVSLGTIMYILHHPEHETILGWSLRPVFRNTMLDNKKVFELLMDKHIVPKPTIPRSSSLSVLLPRSPSLSVLSSSSLEEEEV